MLHPVTKTCVHCGKEFRTLCSFPIGKTDWYCSVGCLCKHIQSESETGNEDHGVMMPFGEEKIILAR